jgi:hypothetical protein
MMLILLQNTTALTSTQDGIGWTTYAIGGILLCCVVLLFFVLRSKKDNKKTITESTVAPATKNEQNLGQEEAAAIAMALHLYNGELHDKESFVITMKKVSQIYSPWNSKIYTLRQTPIRK